MTCEVVNAECLEHMRTLPDNCIDAVVTDPPYGIAFMGAKWDSFGSSTGGESIAERRDKMNEYGNENAVVPRFPSSHGHSPKLSEMQRFQEYMTPVFAEALRVSKPGAHLLCFGGTRTFHRMACAIEEAGWEVRDCVMWVYSTGFPKSMNVAKAIDKASGYVGEVVGERTVDVGMQGGNMRAGRKQQQQQQQVRSLSEQAKEWDGWGTCLKPAWEPVIVARKPLDGTIAHNVLTWGTGAINIDACRVPVDDGDSVHSKNPHTVKRDSAGYDTHAYGRYNGTSTPYDASKGRFPANLAHDGSQMVLDLFPMTNGGKSRKSGSHANDGARNVYNPFKAGNGADIETPRRYGDGLGSAARFFYCAKASRRERGEFNDHPTLKPVALMEWLVKLVTRKGATVLDPFAGSGTTGVACARIGRDFLGIEREEHYCEIARKRIEETA